MRATVSVIIITYRRPEHVRTCLAKLAAQTEPADQILVIDGSEDDDTAAAVAEFPNVDHFHSPSGAGNMTNSRNFGVERTRGDVIAFLDDDAYVEPNYLASLRQAYADSTVALACSRTLNGQPGEEHNSDGGVGRLLPNGSLSGNFAFDSHSDLNIDHGIGATMSFRRSTLAELGGFREDYGGTALREDADVFLRARRLGLRAVFVSDAVAHHVAAAHVTGKRFDLRYEYWAGRNHAVLLLNNFGLLSSLLPRYMAAYVTQTLVTSERRHLSRIVRLAVGLAGLTTGSLVALLHRHGRAAPATLGGGRAQKIRSALCVSERQGEDCERPTA